MESQHLPGTGLSPADLADRTKDFTGRGWVFDQLDAFLGGKDRTFLLTGGPGTGKSAIAARLVQMSSGEASPEGRSRLGRGLLPKPAVIEHRESQWDCRALCHTAVDTRSERWAGHGRSPTKAHHARVHRGSPRG